MKQAYKIFICASIFITSTLFASTSQASDPCSEAKALWKERSYRDIAYVEKRIELRTKIYGGQMETLELDKQMLAKKKEAVTASKERRATLSNDIDAISAQRDKIFELIDPFQREYSKIRFERAQMKLDFKRAELKKRFECAINLELSKKIDELKKRSDLPKNSSEIIARRDAIITDMMARYDSLEKDLDSSFSEYNKSVADLNNMRPKVSDLDTAIDSKYDAIYSVYDRMEEEIDKLSDQLEKISEDLQHNILK